MPSVLHELFSGLLNQATNTATVPPAPGVLPGVDPAIAGQVLDRDDEVATSSSQALSAIQDARAADMEMQDASHTAAGQAGAIDARMPQGGSPSTSLTSGDSAAMFAQQHAAQTAYAQQQAQYVQQMQQYQQQMTAYQQQVWQQAMAQQQTMAMMNQLNAQAQAQAMRAASQQEGRSLSADEIGQMVAELYAEDDNHVAGYDDDGDGKDSGRRTLEASGTDDLGGGENVSLEKVSGGVMSSAEIEDAIQNACDLNGISDDPEVRERFVNVWTQMAMHESGGDPNAGNGWDSNAVGDTWEDGLPAKSSRGAWQCIPDTFAANHVAGTSTSIYDPEASAAASVNYVMQRYGVGPNGEGLDEFAAARGIDPDTGEMVGSYVGY